MITLIQLLSKVIQILQLTDLVRIGLENVITKLCSTYNENDRRKICAAVAMIADPNIVILDEPANNMDTVSRKALYVVVKRMKSKGQSAVISLKRFVFE